MSSFASLLVAKAKATPEKVVPYRGIRYDHQKFEMQEVLQNQYQQSVELCSYFRHQLQLRQRDGMVQRQAVGPTDMGHILHPAEDNLEELEEVAAGHRAVAAEGSLVVEQYLLAEVAWDCGIFQP
jgi:hypothetical protein